VSEAVIAAIYLLEEKSVDEIVARLTTAELEQVIQIVGRSPRGYAPGAYEALKQERHRRSSEPPAERLSPNVAFKDQAGHARRTLISRAEATARGASALARLERSVALPR
jgi:hypothetical protein